MVFSPGLRDGTLKGIARLRVSRLTTYRHSAITIVRLASRGSFPEKPCEVVKSLLPMHEKDLKALQAYLTENTPHHPLEALRVQMVKAGHTPDEAEHAIAVFEGRVRPPEGAAWPLALG